MITAFDDMFSNTVAIRTSYTFNELVYGAKFEPMFTRSTDNLNNPKFRSVERLQKGFFTINCFFLCVLEF
jgi:hypothetical protein